MHLPVKRLRFIGDYEDGVLIAMTEGLTPKQRMLNAYRGIKNDRIAIAPEFWYYYPAKLLGVDMIEFELEVSLHEALKYTFEKFECEGWGIVFAEVPNEKVTVKTKEKQLEDGKLEIRKVFETSLGKLETAQIYSKENPSWVGERAIKNLEQLDIWEIVSFGGEPEEMDVSRMIKACKEVGHSYLLEAWLGVPFFDFYATSRQGGFEKGIYDFCNLGMQEKLKALQKKYIERLVRTATVICQRTPLQSLCIGCEWSCNSLIGPELWRIWDKPVIEAVAKEVHRHNKLLHIHFHGKCMETVSDFAEVGIDCVCPFERPPGGDINGLEGLEKVSELLQGKTTMNGNVNTVHTLIKGTTGDVRREVMEVIEAFNNNPRVILGTGDQVGRETPIENLNVMIETAKKYGRARI